MFKSQRKRHIQQKGRNFGLQVETHGRFPFRLSFYDRAPKFTISIEEFENWAIDRLKVLGEIESAYFKNRSPKETEASIRNAMDRFLPLSSNIMHTRNLKIIEEERQRDLCSHFILRLAFCRTDDLKQRFIRDEVMLFKQRFLTDNLKEREQFIKSCDFGWTKVSDEEKESILDKLKSCQKDAENESYFKVDFEQVCDLVQNRSIYLEGGKAFVPNSEQLFLVLAEFRSNLEQALDRMARALPQIDEDDRLEPILKHLAMGFFIPEPSTDVHQSGKVWASQVESLASHFPLCMRNLFNDLKRDQHLRHFGRLQFGLFLKGIGLSVEEALLFWRQNFSCTDEKFNKEYRYNIRHSYGLEGNRRDYKPFSCQQIISGPQPGPGDCHGCPFRHFSQENLRKMLSSIGIHPGKPYNEIMEAVNGKCFHVACSKTFESTHDTMLQDSITHPNQYYELSRKVANEKSKD